MVQWWVNAPTATETAQWAAIGQQLGLTDFNPLSVHWNEPIKWKIEATDGYSGGNIMSFAAGMLLSVGFGVFFSIVTVALTKLEQKFAGVTITSEHFNTAGRDVKTGLTAAVIVSQWTWAATPPSVLERRVELRPLGTLLVRLGRLRPGAPLRRPRHRD